MEIYNAYEILDKLAEKSNIFKMIRDDVKAKDERIAALEESKNMLEGAIMELTMALAEIGKGGE